MRPTVFQSPGQFANIRRVPVSERVFVLGIVEDAHTGLLVRRL